MIYGFRQGSGMDSDLASLGSFAGRMYDGFVPVSLVSAACYSRVMSFINNRRLN